MKQIKTRAWAIPTKILLNKSRIGSFYINRIKQLENNKKIKIKKVKFYPHKFKDICDSYYIDWIEIWITYAINDKE